MEILYFASNSSIANSSSLENYKVCTSGEDKHCKNSDNIFNINDHTNYYGINVAEFGLNGCKKIKKIFLKILIIFVMFLIDQSNEYCCFVSPPDCNIFGCNCDCHACNELIDKACCMAEKTGMGDCSDRNKHSALLKNYMRHNSNFFYKFFLDKCKWIISANGYCCKVDSFIRGHPPDCNIFGCNCDCDKCESVVDKGCCLAEKTGIGLCNNKRKRSLMEQDLKSFFGEEYEKLMKKND
ncbi:hypothetical protein Mgra_00006475 [Meloidogyne graminicola]|uniref:Uncharacterized protein n=1 Tax=Meloidogyne graminicola TaxID=189291 RepID=A0A8S9ZLX6_9BILA|nr:hypothetical protein Mgra_00006475 [Meloidogyne graminicola]